MRLTSKPASRHGFTLTELAIVLAVVGGVVIAIWVATADVMMNRNITAANNQLIGIVNNIRVLHAEKNGIVDGSGTAAAGSSAALTTAMDQAKVFPPEMRGSVRGQIWHPWNVVAGPGGLGNVELGADQCNGAGSSGNPDPCVGIFFYNLSARACQQFLTSLVIRGVPIVSAMVNGAAANLPVDLGTAAGLCAGNVNTIELIYRVKE